MTEEIRALLIYEILGKPPEHIKKSLEDFLDSLDGNKGIRVVSKKVHEPKILEKEEMKDIKDLYTTFAEAEVVVDNLNLLFGVILNTLPANVEVLEPSSLRLNNFDLSGVLSELTIKLHKYDEIAKTLVLERNALLKKVSELEGLGQVVNVSVGGKDEGVGGEDRGEGGDKEGEVKERGEDSDEGEDKKDKKEDAKVEEKK